MEASQVGKYYYKFNLVFMLNFSGLAARVQASQVGKYFYKFNPMFILNFSGLAARVEASQVGKYYCKTNLILVVLNFRSSKYKRVKSPWHACLQSDV